MSLIADGWANILKGLGSTAIGSAVTKLYGSTVPIVGDSQYAQLYESDWLARRIVQTFPQEALRKLPVIKDAPEDEAAELWRAYDALDTSEIYPDGILAQGLYEGRALGGAAILLGFRYGGRDLRRPAPEPGERSELAWLDVVPWAWLTVVSRNDDPQSARFGLPEILRVSGQHPRNGLELHASRLIVCEGAGRAVVSTGEIAPWLSVLQPVYDILMRYGLSWEAASVLLQEASVGVMKMAGLVDLLAAKNEEAVQGRMQLMTEGRSSARTVFLDAEHGEDFKRAEVGFVGLPATLELLERQISGAARIPATKLFGRSPDGQNSTGESDIRLFYDDVAAYQRAAVWPKQERLLSLIAGRPVELEYPPLWEVSELDLSTIRQRNAETDRLYYDLSVLQPADILQSRAADGSLGIDVEDVEGQVRALRVGETEPEPTTAPTDEG